MKHNFNNDMNYQTYIWEEMGIAIVVKPEKDINDEFKMLQLNK